MTGYHKSTTSRNNAPQGRQIPIRSRAVRSIPKASKGHFVGELVFNRGSQRQRLGFASLTEHNAALCLIYRPDFYDIEEQLDGLPFNLPNGKPSKHFFDFRFTNKAQRRVCISVKRESVAKTFQYRSIIAQVKRAAIGNICDDVKTITERNINPILLHNVTLYHAARDPDQDLDDEIFAQLGALTTPVQVSDFLEDTGIGGEGFFSVVRGIRHEVVSLLTNERITGKAFIQNRANV